MAGTKEYRDGETFLSLDAVVKRIGALEHYLSCEAGLTAAERREYDALLTARWALLRLKSLEER